MDGENTSSGDGVSEMMRHLFDMAVQGAESFQKWSGNQVTPETMRRIRSDVIKMWSDYWEHLLRSSAFLGAEKQLMAGSLEYRKQMHEFLDQLHHEMRLATASDIDQLMRTLRRMAEDQQEQYDQIRMDMSKMAAQIDKIDERLESAEKRSPPAAAASSDQRNRRKPNPKNKKISRRR